MTQPSERELPIDSQGVVTEHSIVDTKGRLGRVLLARYPSSHGYAIKPNVNHFEADPRITPYKDQVLEVLRLAFRDTDDQESKETKSRFGYIATDDAVDFTLMKDAHGQEIVAAVHSYRTGTLKESNPTLQFIYTHYSAVNPYFQGGNLRRITAQPMMDKFQPDIFVGSTHSNAIYLSVAKMAKELDYEIFPRPGVNVPQQLFFLGQSVLNEALGQQSVASLDGRLVRTTSGPYMQDASARPFPFFEEELRLTPNQAVLYIAVRKKLPLTFSLASRDG